MIVDGDDVRDGLSPVEERETAATRPADEEAVTALNRLLRQGRSLDIHTVLNVRQIEADPWLATAAGCISSIVEVDDRGMSATSRSVTVPRTPIDVVLAVNSEEASCDADVITRVTRCAPADRCPVCRRSRRLVLSRIRWVFPTVGTAN